MVDVLRRGVAVPGCGCGCDREWVWPCKGVGVAAADGRRHPELLHQQNE